jgi:hypothetical protein
MIVESRPSPLYSFVHYTEVVDRFNGNDQLDTLSAVTG